MRIYAVNDYVKKWAECFYPGEMPLPNAKLNSKVLLSKKAFLIDVFNTFVLPSQIDHGDFSPKDGFRLREGFLEFLRHYRSMGKKIAIHTDSIPDQQMQGVAKLWGIANYVDAYFGRNSMSYINPETGELWQNIPMGGFKDFPKMVKELGVSLEDAIVIGDGASETLAAQFFGIDLLLITRYDNHHTYPTSFIDLIFGKPKFHSRD